MSFFVYILKCSDGTFYVGFTNDPEKRLHAHNYLKTGAKYTKGRRPVGLVYKQKHFTMRKAKQNEYKIKQLTRKEKVQLVVDFKRRNKKTPRKNFSSGE